MKKIIIILVLLIVLAGGNGAAWWVLLKDKNPACEVTEDGADPAEACVAEAAEEEPKKTDVEEKADTSYFVKMNQIIVPLINEDDELVQYVLIHAMLEVSEEKYVSVAHRLEPKVRDQVYQSLYGALHSGSAFDKNQVLILEDIKKKAIRAAREVLGEGIVTDVLIQDVGQKPV